MVPRAEASLTREQLSVPKQKPTPFVWVRGQALGLDPSASPPSPEEEGRRRPI